MSKRSPRDAAEKIAAVLRQNGFDALLAGGCVRDLVLGREPKDYDVATNATPDQIVALFRRTEKVGAKFGVVIVRLYGFIVEVATFRTEGEYHDGRHPESVRFATVEEDAQRRDFTINGMFLDPLSGRVIDYVGGQDDLRAGRVRAIGDPAKRFAEDHLRMLRAVRFAAALGFEIEADTLAAIRAHAPRLADISIERIQQELDRILTSGSRARGWRLLHDGGLLGPIFPEAPWSARDVTDVSQRLDRLPEDADFMLALAVVLRRFEPSAGGRVCRRLRCSTDLERGVVWLLNQLEHVLRSDSLELADLKLMMADPRFERLAHLLRAECTTRLNTFAPYETLMARAAAIPPERVAPPPLMGGADLNAMNIPEGPIYRQVLDAVYRAQLNERIGSREAAVQLAQRLLREAGFTGQ